ERKDLFLHLFDLRQRHAAPLRETEKLLVDGGARLSAGPAKIEQYAPGLQLVDECALQADRFQLLHRPPEVLGAYFFRERPAIEVHRSFEKSLPRIRVGNELHGEPPGGLE